MKKILIAQKIMFVLYIISMIAMVIYALGFMTNYQVFRDLFYEENMGIYHFHHETLIPYNNFIFYLSIVGVVSIIAIFVCKINKKAPNLWQVIGGSVITIPTIISCVYSISKLPEIKSEYNGFDFSLIDDEIYEPYYPSTTAFDIGLILSILVLVLMVIYLAIIITNFVLLLKKDIKNHNQEICKN